MGASALDEELATLAPEERAWVNADLSLRRRAAELAKRLELDSSDVYHQLKHLARSPAERLRLGFAHGRLRPRRAE